ncbi:MAG: PDZ domain-containing protein [Propionibacteriaceae bacterium]|nr:PDZ domain-containing protein [Propionibacteriaceae bacterium]
MTRQTWTATVSAVLFVVLAAVIALVQVPYVTWSPGATHDLFAQNAGQDTIAITGADTYPTSGQMRMTTVAVTAPNSTLSLPEVLFSYWLPSREVLPRNAVYRPGEGTPEISEEESQMMDDSQSMAVVAALRQSGIEVTNWPMVTSVSNSGPSADILQPGDLIVAVDGKTTADVQAVQQIISEHHVGDPVVFTVQRPGEKQRLRPTVITRATVNNPKKPIVGIMMSIGYSYSPDVKFAIDPSIGGSSAGLMFSLAIHDLLTSADLAADRVIAGSGTMDSEGRVGAVGGVQEKIAAAVRDRATIFLLPKANCSDVGDVPKGLRVVPVDSLARATEALQKLADPALAASVPECP